MARKNRRIDKKKINIISLLVSVIGIGILSFVITFILYKDNLQEEIDSDKSIAQLVNDNSNKDTTHSASTPIGKTVNEIINNTTTNTIIENSINTIKNEIAKNEVVKDIVVEEKTQEISKEPTFIMPIEGNILKEFAKDNLVYSETLQEWTTHNGIDIAGEQTTIVKASADGTVKFIKSDPRYGLTVIIEHNSGYTTVYSNLLTAEFVSTGENVTQGQTIGTVGNTSTFESQDESHLHFEILKDNQYVDPTIYIK